MPVWVENGRFVLSDASLPVTEVSLVSLNSPGIVRRSVEDGGQEIRLRSSQIRVSNLLMGNDVAEETLSEDGGGGGWRCGLESSCSLVDELCIAWPYCLQPET